jgi:hypothetical protein
MACSMGQDSRMEELGRPLHTLVQTALEVQRILLLDMRLIRGVRTE